MDKLVRKKEKGLKKLINSLRYCCEGIKYGYKNEQSFTLHLIVALLVIIASFIFKISSIEWVIVIFCIASIMACELINTAVEAVVDLVTTEKRPLAKIAKDTSAAASLVLSITSIVIGIIIFLPKLIEVIKGV